MFVSETHNGVCVEQLIHETISEVVPFKREILTFTTNLATKISAHMTTQQVTGKVT